MPPAAAHFPDAFVRLLPVVAQPVDQPREAHPDVVADRLTYLLYRYTASISSP